MTSTELRERYPRASGLPAFDEALAALEAAEACNSALEATLEDLYSAEPCPKCGAGVTGACWGCVAAKYRARAEQLEAALRGSDGLICRLQGFCRRYLEPGRLGLEDFADLVIGTLDGQEQRDIQAATRALFAPKEASDGQQ